MKFKVFAPKSCKTQSSASFYFYVSLKQKSADFALNLIERKYFVSVQMSVHPDFRRKPI